MNMMTTFRPALPAEMEVNSFGRHAEWLAEYDAAFDFANEVGIGASVRAQRCKSLTLIEQRVLDTPALNAEEMRAKIRMAQRINQQGFALDENDSIRLFDEALNWIGGGAPSSPVAAQCSEWQTACSAYATARAAEAQCHDGTPTDEEADRLADARIKAERALMAVPSPSAEAFVYKYLAAFAEGRAAVEYADMLEAEALRLSPAPFLLFSKADQETA